MKKATGLSNMAAVQVPHCWNAQAVTLTFPTGFKFSYSGDCRPSKEFVKIGKGSTVLVHEATFDDELQGDAEAKKHSTTSEAIGVGMAMGAKRVVLTHFSQRYQKIPVMENIGFMGVRLEDADETGEVNTPIVDADLDDLSNNTTQEDVIMQIDDDATEKGSLNEKENNRQNNGASSEPKVSFSRPLRSPSTSSRPLSSDLGQSETKSSVVVSPVAINDMKICVAFDYMRVKVNEIAHMEKYTPALLELYQQEDGDEKDASTQEQISNETENKDKRKDESDDEARKGEKKKNNEEINRGKSNRQIRKEQRGGKKSDKAKEQEQGKKPNDTIDAESVLPPTKNVTSHGKSLPDQKTSTVVDQEYQAEKAKSDAVTNASAINTSSQVSSIVGIPLKGQKSWSDIVEVGKAEASKIPRERLAYKDAGYEALEEKYRLIGSSIKQTHLGLGGLDRTMTRRGWGPLLTAARIQSYNDLMVLRRRDSNQRRRLRRERSKKARGLAYTPTTKIPIPSSPKSLSNAQENSAQQRSAGLSRPATIESFTDQAIKPIELCSSDDPESNSEPPTAKVPIRRYSSVVSLIRRFEILRRFESVRKTYPRRRNPPPRLRKHGTMKAPTPEPIELSNWDSMLANVAREVDVDLMKADHHGRASEVRAH